MSEPVTTVDAGPHKVTRTTVVDAPASELFAIVVDPHRHPELDGSGTVRATPVTGPDRLTTGATFSVGMKQLGVPYKITSTATEVVEDRVVAWQHPMGHTWRWEFEALSPTSTRVTETFDYDSARSPRVLELLGMEKSNAVGITRTLEKLQARYA
ncbi:MAG: dimethyladenosine transferase [Nocardioidaceae bacterium]|nr:dimethyladenosine transferase [Nocardioidaceae bacterium]